MSTESRTGDTVAEGQVIEIDRDLLADTPEAQGDEVITDPDDPNAVVAISTPGDLPTAKDLREKGYDIPEDADDDKPVIRYDADRVVSADDEKAVQEVELATNATRDDDRTALEIIGDSDDDGHSEEKKAPKSSGAKHSRASE